MSAHIGAISSVGRAAHLHCEGRGFKSLIAHKKPGLKPGFEVGDEITMRGIVMWDLKRLPDSSVRSNRTVDNLYGSCKEQSLIAYYEVKITDS